MEPIRDQIVFDWVLALGSTNDAAALLDLPQSSVSRRYRALAQQFALSTRRHRGILALTGDEALYRKLRELSQIFRLQKHRYRWSWQPALRDLLNDIGQVGDSSVYLPLTDEQWEQRHDHHDVRILDTWWEVCSPSDADFAGVMPVPLQLRLPKQHKPADLLLPLSALAKRWPLSISHPDLSSHLWEALAVDGLQRQGSNGGSEAMELVLGRGGAGCVPLPAVLHAGWRLPPALDGVAFNPALLEQATAPLRA